jgi:hypothetical protein
MSKLILTYSLVQVKDEESLHIRCNRSKQACLNCIRILRISKLLLGYSLVQVKNKYIAG